MKQSAQKENAGALFYDAIEAGAGFWDVRLSDEAG
jgi:hypothetical protein